MARVKGIHAHPIFKLGKGNAKRDQRNFRFAEIVRPKAPPLPAAYDFDVTHPHIPTPMFGNDVHGDCVIAGRAHQTLRFEDLEQNKVITITAKDVLNEYFKETGGPDSGLAVLDSLKSWRSKGWKVGKSTYAIQAFAEVDRQDHDQVCQAIFGDVGIGLGLQLPTDAQQQFQTGQPWDVTTGPGAKPGSWGGHYVYVSGYTASGPVCVTWGRKQSITWAWFDKYCDEAYAIFDAHDGFKKALIDKTRLSTLLDALDE